MKQKGKVKGKLVQPPSTSWVTSLNKSNYMIGLAMIFLNVGSRYVDLKFSKTQEQALRNGLGRKILIFSMVFMATRDIITATLMTAAFIIMADYVFNERSKFCIINKSLQNVAKEMDLDGDGEISKEEEKLVLDLIRNAKRRKNNPLVVPKKV